MVRGAGRARIGAGTTGPGAALWVEATVIEEGQRRARPGAGPGVQGPGRRRAAAARRLAGDRRRPADRRPLGARRQRRLRRLPGRRPEAELLETADVVQRLELAIGWAREHLAELDVAETIRKDVQEGMDKQQREFLLRQQLAAVRKELRELRRRVRRDRGRRPAGPRRGGRPAGEGARGRAHARSTSWSARPTSHPRPAGSGPGSTPCSSCRGTSGPRTTTTSPAPVRCWTPTTPASTT